MTEEDALIERIARMLVDRHNARLVGTICDGVPWADLEEEHREAARLDAREAIRLTIPHLKGAPD